MDSEIRSLVRQRADDRCEYCLLRQKHSHLSHHIEHIVARQHGGNDDASNLALAGHRCNLRKGPNLTGIDPVTGQIEKLFDPRTEEWAEHFRFRGTYLLGLTRVGRTTIEVLALNDPRRLELRREILALDEWD